MVVNQHLFYRYLLWLCLPSKTKPEWVSTKCSALCWVLGGGAGTKQDRGSGYVSRGDGSAVGQPNWVGVYGDSYHNEKVHNVEQRHRQVLGTLGMGGRGGCSKKVPLKNKTWFAKQMKLQVEKYTCGREAAQSKCHSPGCEKVRWVERTSSEGRFQVMERLVDHEARTLPWRTLRAVGGC